MLNITGETSYKQKKTIKRSVIMGFSAILLVGINLLYFQSILTDD